MYGCALRYTWVYTKLTKVYDTLGYSIFSANDPPGLGVMLELEFKKNSAVWDSINKHKDNHFFLKSYLLNASR